ncbi:MAG TPA: ABC transporter permease, partial [Candidatus Acidoferrales bacterium]|nr:ABC transporter permease [Candidatus Acidoferrales bacterium]
MDNTWVVSPGARIGQTIKRILQTVQDYTLLSVEALAGAFRKPLYLDDALYQMDIIGIGSLPIVMLAGFFIGAVMVLQTSAQFSRFGETALVGDIVAISLVRELGPSITALLVAGRNSSGIASELGSMQVTEQVDAMRAMGTDPIKKLVTPRVIAGTLMLPLLTAISDFVGLVGGYLISHFQLRLDPVQYWTRSIHALEFGDLVQGMVKPLIFGFILSSVGCYYGL